MNRRVILIFLSFSLVPIYLGFSGGSTALFAQSESNGKVKASVKVEDGLEEVSFDTLNGIVEVALPDDLSDSDTISGTVIAEEKKENDAEKVSQAEDELNGVVVEIEKCKEIKEPSSIAETLDNCKGDKVQEVPPCVVGDIAPSIELSKEKKKRDKESVFTCLVPLGTKEFRIVLRNKRTGVVICSQELKSNTAHKSEAPISAERPPICEFPRQGTCGKSLLIPGRYDGRCVTSKVTIDGRPCRILAESPRKQVIQVPKDCPQDCRIESSECGLISKSVIKLIPSSSLSTVAKNPSKPSGPADSDGSATPPDSECPDLNGNWIANVTPLGGTISGPNGESSVAPNQSPSTQNWRIKQKGNRVTFPCGTSFEMNGCNGIVKRGGASNQLVRKLSYDKGTDTLQMDDEERQQGGGVTSVMRWTIKMQRQK